MSMNGITKQTDAAGSMPAWMMMMRAAAQKAITEADVTEIVRKQVELAKQGNKDALKFVFGQVLGGDQSITLVQNNFSESPATPTNAVPGTKPKLDKMAARVAAGLPACDPADRKDVDLT